MAGMTPKQERFCQEYLLDFNATQAAKRAGYSPRTCETQGSRLLRNVHVKARLDVLCRELTEATELKMAEIVREQRAIAFARLPDFVEWDERDLRVKDVDDMPPELLGALREIEVTESHVGGARIYSKRVKLHDKQAALKELTRYFELQKGPTEQAPLKVEIVESVPEAEDEQEEE